MAEIQAERGTMRDWVVLGFAFVSVGYHLYAVMAGLIPALVARPLHLACAIPFVFFFRKRRLLWDRLLSWAIGALGIAGCLWIAFHQEALADQYGNVDGVLQHGIGILLILMVLEMARRAVQPVMPTIAGLVLLYGLFGHLIPGAWGHDQIPLDTFLGTLSISEGGLWGSLTGTSLELIAPFLILGAVVAAGDAGTGFMSIAQQIAGRYRAGAAKVEVVASGLYGMISGSASANVATTGAFTIPAMIRAGFPRPFAAAVEAVASTGGQIMPPVMGAGVFLMAELLRVPYSDLMAAAALPALLFFVTAWFGVDRYAVVLGLHGMKREELPGWRVVARTGPFFLAPILVLLYLFVFTDYSPQYAAAIATAVAAALLFVDQRLRLSLAVFWPRIRMALLEAANQIAGIAAIIICAGLIVGVFHMTGLGIKFTSLIVGLSGGQLWIALLMTAVACIGLGMELPTTAAYAICIAVAGPALQKLGLAPLQAHLFVFWYALLCTITPPVCGNVYIAARIANTPWLPVAFRAMRLGGGLFVVPLGFVANPSLLALQASPLLAVAAAVKVGVGMYFFSYAVIGRMQDWWKQLIALAAAVAAIFFYGI